MLVVKTVSVTRVTRYIAERNGGLVSADVSIALTDEELGVEPIIDVNVDLPHIEDLTLGAIEERAIEVATSTLMFAAELDPNDLIKLYRAKFHEQIGPSEALLN